MRGRRARLLVSRALSRGGRGARAGRSLARAHCASSCAGTSAARPPRRRPYGGRAQCHARLPCAPPINLPRTSPSSLESPSALICIACMPALRTPGFWRTRQRQGSWRDRAGRMRRPICAPPWQTHTAVTECCSRFDGRLTSMRSATDAQALWPSLLFASSARARVPPRCRNADAAPIGRSSSERGKHRDQRREVRVSRQSSTRDPRNERIVSTQRRFAHALKR